MTNLLYIDIVKKIEDKINKEFFSEGDKLPSEREMSIEFGVSRIVIREAIKVLQEKGLVMVRPGKGAYVTKPKDDSITDTLQRIVQSYNITVEDIVDVREDLELAIIPKAVKKATEKNIQKLKDCYQKMIEKKFLKEFSQEDMNFHLELAEATQNKFYVVLATSFFELTERLLVDVSVYTNTVDQVLEHHKKIIESIEKGDVVLAISTMKEHIKLIRHEMYVLKKHISTKDQ